MWMFILYLFTFSDGREETHLGMINKPATASFLCTLCGCRQLNQQHSLQICDQTQTPIPQKMSMSGHIPDCGHTTLRLDGDHMRIMIRGSLLTTFLSFSFLLVHAPDLIHPHHLDVPSSFSAPQTPPPPETPTGQTHAESVSSAEAH